MELIGAGVRLLVEDSPDEETGAPGVLLEVSNDEHGQAALVLEREDVMQLVEELGSWLVDTEPDPAIPGRPL